MTLNDSLMTAVVSILGGGGFYKFLQWFVQWRARRSNITRVLERAHQAYSLLGLLLARCPAKRVVLFRVENGGDIPAVGKDLYSSVAYEHFDTLPSLREEWQKERCDPPTIAHLLRLAQNGTEVVTTEHLPEGMLRDRYVADEVVTAISYAVASLPGAFFYLDLHFVRPFKADPEFRSMVRGVVNRLNQIFLEDFQSRQ